MVTTGAPIIRAAWAPGLPSVAEAQRKTGSLPWKRAMRRSRRRTLATCEPKTPVRAWSSSTMTKRSEEKKRDQLAWCGSIPPWSMSGLVMITLARSRARRRASALVSPS
jgi:hypothetical protein